MLETFIKIIPLFALVGLGYLCKKHKIVGVISLKYLTRFVMYLSLPAVLLGKLASTDFETLLDIPFLTAYLISLISVMFTFGLVGYFLFEKRANYGVMLGLGGVYGNIGFLAIPLLAVTVGEWTSVPLALMLTLDLLILLPFSSFLLQLSNTNNTYFAHHENNFTPFKALKRSLLNPLIISIIVGLILSAWSITLPASVIEGLALLGSGAGPCAMFIVGTALFGRSMKQNSFAAIYMSTVKLAIMPFVVFLMMTMFQVNSVWILIATLGSAMPCAAVLGVMAEEYKTLSHQASTAVLLTTVVSVVTLPLLIHFLK
ncbi:AEC family transporter [Paraglaciecola sp. L3A3]|uniref:AEC family transporter n=1 Tax=Paraglaciecola sp. L3A3 TaxID=2686358 RepID=UPI00131E7645|nr:AEC family transporter [Paraglaciecola sp. L3A3]